MTSPDLDTAGFERVVFFTGAGLSAECGVPTYRGAGGIWGAYAWEDHACQRAFERDPERVWAFHDERRKRLGAAQPGLAHRIIARVQRERPSTRIVTQNIDGLHQRGGAREVIELHGSIWRARCACPGSPFVLPDAKLEPRHCARCHQPRRPDIVWFEDTLPAEAWRTAMEAIAACDLLVSVGTSGVVHPAAQLPRLAARGGATCVEVNPEETPVSGWYDLHLRAAASVSLAQLWPQWAECA